MDMDAICRVCRRRDQEMILIFDEKYAEGSTTLAAILSMLTNYKVRRFDELPQQICGNCRNAAQSAFRFKKECEHSYRLLMGMLKDAIGIPPDDVKSENEDYSDKGTQTDDISIFPCERCDEKFFTCDALKEHREHEHKGSAIECRFCAKSFNRIGYLRTHIAVFHPDEGFTSHNQCSLCHRQFTRRAHLRSHMALKHKIVESADDCPRGVVEEFIKEQDSSIDNLSDHNRSEGCDIDLENDIFASPINIAALKEEYIPDVGKDNIEATENDSSDEEDDAPLSNFISKVPTNAGEFIEVLLSENVPDTEKPSPPLEPQSDAIGPSEPLPEEKSVKVKRGRGRPPRMEKAITGSRKAPNERQFKCCDCDRVFQHRATLQRHMLNHADEKEYACTVCPKRFTRPDYLKSHMTKLHDATRILECEKCDKKFNHISQYNRHNESNHREKEHSCDVCGKNFTTKLYLQRHLNLHNNKRYVCKECSQSFLTKEELGMHIKVAEHDKPMLCPECGLRCKTSNILMVHMRRHKGEKPFKCKFCSKGFPRMDDLRVHEKYVRGLASFRKYHTNEKSHFCETCGKGFQRKYNLTIHLRVHTGERPYKCPHCPQAFAQGNDLKSHIRRHTGERFRCEVCGAAFLQGYQIRQHKLTQHGIKEDPPTQRVAKFTSPEEQAQQIKQNQQIALGSTSTVRCTYPEISHDVSSTAATITETLDQLINDM